jgi:hypothetical protein
VAADDMAAALAYMVEVASIKGFIELAGSESLLIVEFVGWYLTASRDMRTVGLTRRPETRHVL